MSPPQTQMNADASTERLDIRININRLSDGCVYGLHPRSALAIKTRFPGAHPAPTVFIGYETQADFEMDQGPMWKQVAAWLTGLSPQQLDAHADVVLFDPVAKTVLYKVK